MVSRFPPQLADKADRAGRAGAAMTADATPADYDPLYLQGIVHFNACDYYESHEVWEELWTEYRGPSRKFYQGLIQAAVALYHFGNGNIRGARKLHGSVHGYLEPYAPRHLGLDLTGFLHNFDACLGDPFRLTATRCLEPLFACPTSRWPSPRNSFPDSRGCFRSRTS
jgi:hypothetical protein